MAMLNWNKAKSGGLPLCLASLLLIDCARIRRDIAEYDAQSRASKPKSQKAASSKPNESYTLVTVKTPAAELQVAYKSRDNLVKALEGRPRYQRLDSSERS